jgi:hypothetical protein
MSKDEFIGTFGTESKVQLKQIEFDISFLVRKNNVYNSI